MITRPFWTPEIGHLERVYIERTLADNYLNDGHYTREFEQRIANLLDSKYAVGVTSGTIALYLSLYGLGVGLDDEVLVPDVTFVASANAVTMTGARPVLVDVCEDTLLMDLAAAERALTDSTRAIMPVHLSGRALRMNTVLEFAQRFNLVVVEDAAEAFLSSQGGRYLGTFGDAGCFSFSPNKTITTGQGGVIVTDNESLALKLRELKDQGRSARGTGGADRHDSVGFNFKLTNLQASVGLAQLEYLDSRIERMRANCHQYTNQLRGVEGLRVMDFDLQGGVVPQWTDALAEQRDRLIEFLERHSVLCREFWHPVHTHKPYRQPDTRFPVSSRQVPKALWLPSAFQLTPADIHAVCQKIIDFYERR